MRRRNGRWGAALSVALLGVALVGCGDGGADSGSVDLDPAVFSVEATTRGFQIAWDAAGGLGTHPDIEVAEQSPLERGWTDPDDWVVIPTEGVAGDSVAYDEVTAGHRYAFRVRTADGEWSEPVERLHVDTVLPEIHIGIDHPNPVFDERKNYYDVRVDVDPASTETGDRAERLQADARIRARGNSTLVDTPGKKSYQLKFDQAEALLGLPAARRWVLLANYFDPTQIRNYAAMQVAQATGLDWVPAMEWVEVYLDGDYVGVYNLFEKVDTGPGKVDIEPPAPEATGGEDITGGYLLQMEMDEKDHKTGWVTPHGVRINVQRPKQKYSNAEQFAYIRDHVNAFEAALFSDEFTDPERGYRPYLDVESFIDLWIVQEVTSNSDAYVDSLYFYKKRDDDKLYFGPPWDFDNALASRFQPLRSSEDWYTVVKKHPDRRHRGRRSWVLRLFEDPWFHDQAVKRWRQVRPEIERIPGLIEDAAAQIDDAIANDHLRWKDAEDTRLMGIRHRYGDLEEVDDAAYIARWLRERIAFMSAEIGRIPVPDGHR